VRALQWWGCVFGEVFAVQSSRGEWIGSPNDGLGKGVLTLCVDWWWNHADCLLLSATR
jgi:hypothetical protein